MYPTSVERMKWVVNRLEVLRQISAMLKQHGPLIANNASLTNNGHDAVMLTGKTLDQVKIEQMALHAEYEVLKNIT